MVFSFNRSFPRSIELQKIARSCASVVKRKLAAWSQLGGAIVAGRVNLGLALANPSPRRCSVDADKCRCSAERHSLGGKFAHSLGQLGGK